MSDTVGQVHEGLCSKFEWYVQLHRYRLTCNTTFASKPFAVAVVSWCLWSRSGVHTIYGIILNITIAHCFNNQLKTTSVIKTHFYIICNTTLRFLIHAIHCSKGTWLIMIEWFAPIFVFVWISYLIPAEEQHGDLTTWVNRERFPSYTKLDSYTLYAMGDTGKSWETPFL